MPEKDSYSPSDVTVDYITNIKNIETVYILNDMVSPW